MRSRLIRLEVMAKNDSAAWELVDECFRLVEISPVTSLGTSRFEILECTRALNFLPQYAAYRASYPVSDYWNPNDPLYDLPFAPPVPCLSQEALTTFLAVPFGLGLYQLEEDRKRDSKKSLTLLFDTLRKGIEDAVSEAGRTLAGLVPSKDCGSEATAAKLADLMIFLGLISLREFGRQRGWIAAQFRIKSASMEGAMDSYNESQIEKNVMSKAFTTINENLNILPY